MLVARAAAQVHPTRRHRRVVTLDLRPAPKRLAWQGTYKRGDVASRLHSDVRRQPSTRTHRAVGADDDWPPLELAVARDFVGRKKRPGAHAHTVPEYDKVLIWATNAREGMTARQQAYVESSPIKACACAHPSARHLYPETLVCPHARRRGGR